MAWKVIDRNEPVIDSEAPPILSAALKEKIRSFFPRYETKRAVLLPALHIIQNALGHIGHQAMKEVAELLDLHPADVLDVISFYTHFFPHPKGQKTIVVCRSLTCELMGGKAVLEKLKSELRVEDHGTTADGKYTLMTEECLAACDYAPCMLVNERLHKNVRANGVGEILADQNNDRISGPRSSLLDPPGNEEPREELVGAGESSVTSDQ